MDKIRIKRYIEKNCKTKEDYIFIAKIIANKTKEPETFLSIITTGTKKEIDKIYK